MTDTLFEKFGGTYTQQGDYLLPNLALPAEKDDRPIGIWGQRRLRYLKQYHKVIYYNLLTSGKLHSHLADTEEQAQQLFLRLVKELAEKEGVTEQLKSADQMAWVRRMNNIRECVFNYINWCCTIKVDIGNSKGQYIEKDKQEATKDGSESTKIQHGI